MSKLIKSHIARFVVLVLTSALSATSFAAPGDVVSITPLSDMTQAQAKNGISEWCPSNSKGLVYAVKRYKVNYETTDLYGKPTVASGLLMIPDGMPGSPAFISYQHGTITSRRDAPSSDGLEGEVVGYCLAATGHLVAAADYLGLGDSMLDHPYYHAITEASASADMLRATRKAAAKLDVQVGSQLFLTGFSQGGHATMALHRYLQESLSSEFTVTASALISGPYDLDLHFRLTLKHPDRLAPFKAAYIPYSMNKIYGIWASLEGVIKPDVLAILPEIFDGTHTHSSVVYRLPKTPEEVLQPEFLKDILSNPANPLREVLRKNETYDWKPIAPVTFFFGDGDITVNPKNSKLAYKHMKGLGGNVRLENVGNVDHTGSLSPSFVRSVKWFDQLTQ